MAVWPGCIAALTIWGLVFQGLSNAPSGQSGHSRYTTYSPD